MNSKQQQEEVTIQMLWSELQVMKKNQEARDIKIDMLVNYFNTANGVWKVVKYLAIVTAGTTAFIATLSTIWHNILGR